MASKNIVLKGATYNGVESITLPTSPSGTATFCEISDTTATASDVLNSKYFYTAAGVKTQGTGTAPSPTLISKSITQNGTYNASSDSADGYSSVIVNVSGGGGPSAELVQKWTYDKQIVRDESVTLPAWSTSLQTLKASADLSPSITLDISNYYYFVNLRTLAYPIYSGSSLYKGKTDYSLYANLGQMLNIPANTIKDRTGSATVAALNTYKNVGEVRCVYWNSATQLVMTGTAYGGVLSAVTPSFSATSLTVKSPTLDMRGNANYYNETAYNETTDIRYQYIIEVYRIAKQNAPENLDGMLVNQFEKIIDSVNNNNMTLT